MALTHQIEKIMKEYDYNLFTLAEALIDLREESADKIAELEKEMATHEC